MSKSDTFSAIQSHVVDGEPLNRQQQTIFERWTAAFTLFCKYPVKSIVVQQLMSQFDISQTQAYRDLQESERVFGNARKYTKEALRYIMIESLLKDIDAYDKRAKLISDKKEKDKTSLDFKVWESLKRLKIDAHKAIGKIASLEKDDELIPDFSGVQIPNIELTVGNNAIAALQDLLKLGAVDLDNLPKQLLNPETIEEAIVLNESNE